MKDREAAHDASPIGKPSANHGIPMTATFTDALAALQRVTTTHATARGERVGFLMADAARALGGLANASNSLAVLMAEGLVDSEPVEIGGDVHTLYRLTGAAPPVVH